MTILIMGDLEGSQELIKAIRLLSARTGRTFPETALLTEKKCREILDVTLLSQSATISPEPLDGGCVLVIEPVDEKPRKRRHNKDNSVKYRSDGTRKNRHF